MNKKECCICYEETDKEDFKVLRPCNHEICSKCINEYVKRIIHTCPICRADFNLLEHIGYQKTQFFRKSFPQVSVQIVFREYIPLPEWRNEINRAFSNERSI